MRIIVFGGTTEGRKAAAALLQDGHEVTVSVASAIGEEALIVNGFCKEQGCIMPSEDEPVDSYNAGFLNISDRKTVLKAENRIDSARYHNTHYSEHSGKLQIMVGRKGLSELTQLVKKYDVCLDATHPYALEITENLKEACRKTGTEYIRLARAPQMSGFEKNISKITYVSCASEAAELLKVKGDLCSSKHKTETEGEKTASELSGNILLTTGIKDLHEYKAIERSRLYTRVLPVAESIEACLNAGICHKNIIAMWGPFSEELNTAMIRQYRIKYLVTKESGKEGGYLEKLKACENTGCEAIVIKRPEEEGIALNDIRSLL